MKFGLQLYTVRDLTAKDFAGTMKQVAAIGYQYVEMAGYGNLGNAKAARKALDDAGLKAISGHFAIDMLEAKLPQVMEDAKELGIEMIVCPYLTEDRRKDADGWKATAKTLEKIGSALHFEGYMFGYHNHNFEFAKVGDTTGYDILTENTAAHLVGLEIDVYWVQNAGLDPVKLIEKYGERVKLLHLKDLSDEKEKKFAPVGKGMMDFKAILAAADKAGAKFGFVEQDNTYGAPPLEAIKASFENLIKLGAKKE